MFFIDITNETLWEKIKRITKEVFPFSGEDILITEEREGHLGFSLSMAIEPEKERWRNCIYHITESGEIIMEEKEGKMEKVQISFCY